MIIEVFGMIHTKETCTAFLPKSDTLPRFTSGSQTFLSGGLKISRMPKKQTTETGLRISMSFLRLKKETKLAINTRTETGQRPFCGLRERQISCTRSTSRPWSKFLPTYDSSQNRSPSNFAQ